MKIRPRSAVRFARCPSCFHRGIGFSSAIDGRPRATCGRCGMPWTEGKNPGEGYKRWPARSKRATS